MKHRIRVIASFYKPPFRPSEALTVGGWVLANTFGELTNETTFEVTVEREVPTRVRIYALNEDRLLSDAPLPNIGAVARGDAIVILAGEFTQTNGIGT